MTRRKILVAALPVVLASAAASAQTIEHPSENAQKLLIILNSVGLNDPNIKDFINQVDAHRRDGYISLAERQALGGTFSLRYQMDSVLMRRQLELNYTPNDSHFQAEAGNHGVTVGYHFRW